MKTVSLELSKQLKEAGYPQEGDFDWYRSSHNQPYKFNAGGTWETADKYGRITAPTCDEILDRLPGEVGTRDNPYFLQIVNGIDAKWQIDYRDVNDGQYNAFVEDSLADAAARMYLYLKKEGLFR